MLENHDFWHRRERLVASYNKVVTTRTSQKIVDSVGFGTWLVVGLPILFTTVVNDGWVGLLRWRELLWLGVYLAFGLLFVLETSRKLPPYLERQPLLLLSLLTMLAAGTQFLLPNDGLMSILFCITAVYSAYILPPRWGVYWVFLQTVLIFLSFMWSDNDLMFRFILTFAYFGFQLFIMSSTYATLSEERSKQEVTAVNAQLRGVNAELRATQTLLAESSRVSERLRIARELHDVIGHHLTALSLNLEVASRTTEAKAKEQVERSKAIAKLLLSDVREVVSTLRENESIDISKALHSLVEGIPKPQIHLSVPSELKLEDPNRAHVLIRCLQEIITNTVKHAQAENLWLSLERTSKGITIHAKDDGHGAKTVTTGNGLRGMRERLEQIGGNLSFSSQLGKGFELSAYLPIGAG
jgi:signal transduction histidine kinase